MKIKDKKDIETVSVDYSEFNSPDFKNPSKFFIMNALGEYVFYKTSKRQVAQEAVDNEYGVGKYRVTNYSFNTGSNKEITAR